MRRAGRACKSAVPNLPAEKKEDPHLPRGTPWMTPRPLSQGPGPPLDSFLPAKLHVPGWSPAWTLSEMNSQTMLETKLRLTGVLQDTRK